MLPPEDSLVRSDSHFETTDDFTLQVSGEGAVELGFGASRVQMTKYAATDLLYRLASFLTLLENGPASPVWEEARDESTNVIPLFPERNPHD